MYVRHILHSLSIAKFNHFENESKVLDIGTGGGFPGIPLAILFPETHFTLVDSINKKIRVVSEVANAIALENITPIWGRAEKINGKYDFVVTRAVAPMIKIYNWSKDKISPTSKSSVGNGIIALKGGDLTTEMKELKRSYQQISLQDYFPHHPFFETKSIIYVPV